MADRLKNATSPYLLQHADNPVDWWPWSDEAFAEARARDVPVLLSVGYSACHWCHVMAHESFEDEQTAAIMNEHVVAIKVDREERPDVDSVYMTAPQAMTGQGGWPMTVFMTPDREPFYCGTYFPRVNFHRLIDAVTNAWTNERDQVQEQAAQIAGTLARNATATAQSLRDNAGPLAALKDLEPAAADQALDEVSRGAVAGLAADFDPDHAGLGRAPKCPPWMGFAFLLRHFERTGDPRARELAEPTLEAMARGGMYDQLGGGFAR